LSDEGGRFATPVEVIEVRSAVGAMGRILELIVKEGVEKAVVGLPLNMDDTMGGAAKKAVEWGRELAKKSGVGVVFVDERLSSFEAEQQLVERKRGGEKLTRRRKKERLDALAAAGFLQEYLDGKLGAVDVGCYG